MRQPARPIMWDPPIDKCVTRPDRIPEIGLVDSDVVIFNIVFLQYGRVTLYKSARLNQVVSIKSDFWLHRLDGTYLLLLAK